MRPEDLFEVREDDAFFAALDFASLLVLRDLQFHDGQRLPVVVYDSAFFESVSFTHNRVRNGEYILIIEARVARVKSQDKRNAILEAATQVFAERGLGAATSAISGAAGVAEGTLFTYFQTKDELVNALYREIKVGLADAMMSAFPRNGSVRSRLEHVWNRYVEWGIENPMQQRVLRQVEVWSGLTKESQKAGSAPFIEIKTMAKEAEEQRIFQDLPRRFVEVTMTALAEAVMELVRQDPKKAKVYRSAGFEMLWAGIARK